MLWQFFLSRHPFHPFIKLIKTKLNSKKVFQEVTLSLAPAFNNQIAAELAHFSCIYRPSHNIMFLKYHLKYPANICQSMSESQLDIFFQIKRIPFEDKLWLYLYT